jgi:hypothetical protein
MTREELLDLLGLTDEDPDDDEAVWPVIVEFVGKWMEAHNDGDVEFMIFRWWREML